MNPSFFIGDTINFTVEIKTVSDNRLVDPTSITITIIKKINVVKVNNETMTKITLGKYIYYWHSNEIGSYTVIYKADNNSIITQARDSFDVTKLY